jgi:predicted phage terminase large subunit-like protein
MQYVDVPGYSAILFRRTFADLSLPGALMDRFRTWIAPNDDIHWNNNSFIATFPSGARISFGYLNNQSDYLRYKGSEFQFIGMDEVTEIRESDYRYLFSRLRRPATGPLSQVPLRMRAASNPAPNWVRQRFIVEGVDKGRIFVPSKLADNPGVDAASYRQALQALDPVERRRLEEGDWWSTTLGSLFERTSLVIVDGNEIPQMTSSARVCRFWDLAATEPSEKTPNPDWTVGTLMLFDQGVAYVLDVKKARVKGDKVEQLIAQTAYEDGRTVPIRMEQEPGSSGKALMDQYARYVIPGYDFAALRATGDKVTRARPFAAAVANGNVRVVRGPWLSEWLDEFASFPEACDHDDQVDSAVGAFTFLTGLGLPQRSKATIIV